MNPNLPNWKSKAKQDKIDELFKDEPPFTEQEVYAPTTEISVKWLVWSAWAARARKHYKEALSKKP